MPSARPRAACRLACFDPLRIECALSVRPIPPLRVQGVPWRIVFCQDKAHSVFVYVLFFNSDREDLRLYPEGDNMVIWMKNGI